MRLLPHLVQLIPKSHSDVVLLCTQIIICSNLGDKAVLEKACSSFLTDFQVVICCS